MIHDVWFWLLATFFWTAVMSFYSMQEMACISSNRLRLDYYVAQGKRWAVLLHSLLENPMVLFSTTLIGVNVALMASSECARRVYQALGLDPNWAPVAEIPFVLIFGELVPMFAARTFSDHVTRLGIPLLYISAKLLTPIIAVIDFFFRRIDQLVGIQNRKESQTFLSRDELQKLIEERHGSYFGEKENSALMSNIFSIRQRSAFQLMQRLDRFPCVSTHATVAQVREIASRSEFGCVLVYHRTRQKIAGIAYFKDFLTASDGKKAREFAKPACYVTQEMPALELLFRLHDEEVQDAVVLNDKGEALGICLLEDLVDELLGDTPKATAETPRLWYLEKTCPADTKISDFNEAYGTKIDPEGCTTFAELIEKLLGRHPHVNDTLLIEPLELVVQEVSLFKAKTILIRTKRH